MRIILILLLTTYMASSAPSPSLEQLELSMLTHLHQPMYRPRPTKPPTSPRKGEYMCNGRVCKTRVQENNNNCEDCQYNVPLSVGEWETKSGINRFRKFNKRTFKKF